VLKQKNALWEKREISLRTDVSSWKLIVKPANYSAELQIQIKVLDLNDEIPRFIFPSDNNDTLIIDRTYWNDNNYICQIDIQDKDQLKTHTLLPIYHYDQLKNYDYLNKYKNILQFDSTKFFLDQQERLFFNSSNNQTLIEGVYYLAFKVIIQIHSLKKKRSFLFRLLMDTNIMMKNY